MKKLEVIALLLSAFVEISTSVSIYTAISDSEHVASENRIPKKLQPVELMTDATNHLGFRILNLHSKLNKNNIAFSPCGLMSVLVALYEGTGGRSGIELKEALEFPLERDIVRIGVRDIHRRLRSYFYKRENLLSGLIFNKENITIRQEYETVLRFYGYDLDGTSNMLTESRVDGVEGDSSVTNTTEASTPTSTTTIASSDDEDDATTATEVAPTEEAEDATTNATGEANGADEGDNGGEETTAAPTRKRRGRLGRGLKSKQRNGRDRKPSLATVLVRNPTINRRSRSYYVLLDDDYESGFNFEIASPTPIASISSTHHHHHHHHHYETSRTDNPISTTTVRTTTAASAAIATPVNGPSSDYKYRNSNHKELFENVNSDTIEHIFYLNDYDTVRVPYKLYDTVMKYAYVNPLEASFLEIDLDSEYYNLIIIIPDRIDGLRELAEKLQSSHANSLRHIRNSMEYYWVKTIVPKFNLKGNTILTGDLQNMGINDIFEPTKADFSLMAEDRSLYVKNIEQMININIRTQSTQQLKKISSLYKRPIEVPVNIPFIYCVVDKKLDLTIILGRILNPLNSRIQ